MKIWYFVVFFITLIGFLDRLEAKIQCIDSEGEAAIINDVPSAKAEAISRAKWNAIEQVAGVQVKAQTVVQNFTLVDDAVIKKIQGIVSKYSVKKEWKEKDIYKVIVNVCVDDLKTDEAISSLSINNALAVFIFAKKTTGEFEDINILSETIIGKLTEMGVKVFDVASTDITDAQKIEEVLSTGNYLNLRSIMYRTLSNLLLIGKIDSTISTKEGQDIGYGINLPFNIVRTTFVYRLVAKEKNSSKVVILDAGTEEAKSMGVNLRDANEQNMKKIAEKFSYTISEKITKYLNDAVRKISVKIEGVRDINKNFEIKEILQNITWVTEVQERGLGEFSVSYAENPVYLANSMIQKGFIVVRFSPNFILSKF